MLILRVLAASIVLPSGCTYIAVACTLTFEYFRWEPYLIMVHFKCTKKSIGHADTTTCRNLDTRNADTERHKQRRTQRHAQK
jgi:hypothetical protein